VRPNWETGLGPVTIRVLRNVDRRRRQLTPCQHHGQPLLYIWVSPHMLLCPEDAVLALDATPARDMICPGCRRQHADPALRTEATTRHGIRALFALCDQCWRNDRG
jgi:hypothetical protein